MKLTKRTLAFAIASALGVSSTSALAIVDLSSSNPDDPVYYPSEVNIENGITVDGAAGGDAKFTPQYNLQIGNSVYALLELSGAVVATGGQWDTNAITTSNTNVSVIFVEGGAAGQSHAVFELKAETGPLGATDTFTLYFGSGGAAQLSIASASGVTARVRLYNDVTSAQLKSDTTAVRDYSGQIIGFKNGVSAMVKPNASASTASVDTNFTQFVTNDQSGGASQTDLGGILFDATPGVMDIGTGSQVGLTDMFDAATTLTVEGDFSTATGVFIDNDADGTCNTPSLSGTIDTDKVSASFALGTTTLGNAATPSYAQLCFTADGTTAMDASDYTATLNGVAATGSQYNVGSAGPQGDFAGAIDRDGVVLRTGFVSKYEMKVSKFIFANTGNSDAEITDITIFDPAGATPTQIILPAEQWVLAAGARTEIKMQDMVSLTSMPKQNFMVEFSIGSTNDKIFGTYQLLLLGSTVQTIVPLERLPSSFGQ